MYHRHYSIEDSILQEFESRGFEDRSWRGHHLASFWREDTGVRVFVQEQDPEKREEPGSRRFRVVMTERGSPNQILTPRAYESDSLGEVLDFVDEHPSVVAEYLLMKGWVMECRSRGFPSLSADEVLYELAGTDSPDERYVQRFINLWNTLTVRD
jgi:hypothetical protein